MFPMQSIMTLPSGGTDPTPNESGFGSFGHFGLDESGFGSQFKKPNPDSPGSGSNSHLKSRKYQEGYINLVLYHCLFRYKTRLNTISKL
jgi:hypothetical protein